MPSTKQILTPSSRQASDLNDVLEVRFKLSGDTLIKMILLALSITKLMSLVLSIALGTASILGYFQSKSTSVPTDSPAITTKLSP